MPPKEVNKYVCKYLDCPQARVPTTLENLKKHFAAEHSKKMAREFKQHFRVVDPETFKAEDVDDEQKAKFFVDFYEGCIPDKEEKLR